MMQISVMNEDGEESILCYQSEITPREGEIVFTDKCEQYRVVLVLHVLTYHNNMNHQSMIECRTVPL